MQDAPATKSQMILVELMHSYPGPLAAVYTSQHYEPGSTYQTLTGRLQHEQHRVSRPPWRPAVSVDTFREFRPVVVAAVTSCSCSTSFGITDGRGVAHRSLTNSWPFMYNQQQTNIKKTKMKQTNASVQKVRSKTSPVSVKAVQTKPERLRRKGFVKQMS